VGSMGGAGCFTLVLLSAMGSPFGTHVPPCNYTAALEPCRMEVRSHRPQLTPPGQLTAYLQERVFRT